MPTEIAVALITLVGTTIGAVISAVISAMISNKLSVYRIEQLEKKIEKLNDTLDRIAKIEIHLAALDVRVDTLEEKEKTS